MEGKWLWISWKGSGMTVLNMFGVSRLRWRRPIPAVWWTLSMSKLGRK